MVKGDIIGEVEFPLTSLIGKQKKQEAIWYPLVDADASAYIARRKFQFKNRI